MLFMLIRISVPPKESYLYTLRHFPRWNPSNTFLFISRAGGIASAYRNDARQVAVNHVAEHYGSGTGTARFVGVPGTGNNFGYNHHGHGYAGNGGYGYNHGNNYGY